MQVGTLFFIVATIFFFFACNFMSVGNYSLQPNEEICNAFTFQIKLNSKLPFISLSVSFFVTVFTSIVEAVILIIFLNIQVNLLRCCVHKHYR